MQKIRRAKSKLTHVENAAELVKASMVPRGVSRGHQIGEGRVRLQGVHLVEVKQLGGREGGVGPVGEGGTGQHALQLGVEAVPVGLGQVGHQQAHSVHPLRQPVHGDVGVVLKNHLNR